MRLISDVYFGIRWLLGAISEVAFLSCAVASLLSVSVGGSSTSQPTEEDYLMSAIILIAVGVWVLASFYVKWAMVQGKTESILLPIVAIVSLVGFFVYWSATNFASMTFTLSGMILIFSVLIDIIEGSRIYSFLRTYKEYGYFAPYYD